MAAMPPAFKKFINAKKRGAATSSEAGSHMASDSDASSGASSPPAKKGRPFGGNGQHRDSATSEAASSSSSEAASSAAAKKGRPFGGGYNGRPGASSTSASSESASSGASSSPMAAFVKAKKRAG